MTFNPWACCMPEGRLIRLFHKDPLISLSLSIRPDLYFMYI